MTGETVLIALSLGISVRRLSRRSPTIFGQRAAGEEECVSEGSEINKLRPQVRVNRKI